MSEINQLIKAVQENTQAQLMLTNSQAELAKAISELAVSNRDIVDNILLEDDEEGKESTCYMDGTAKEQCL